MAELKDLLVNGQSHLIGDTYYKTHATGTSDTRLASTEFVKNAIDSLPTPMVFKGTVGTGGTITSLPTNGSADVGNTYKVITDGTYAGLAAIVGDTFICDSKTSTANTWVRIPSGDDPSGSGTVTNVAVDTATDLGTKDVPGGNNDDPIITSGTIYHKNSGVTAGSYGDSSAQTPTLGGTFVVPTLGVNARGHVTSVTTHTVTIPSTVVTGVTVNGSSVVMDKVASISVPTGLTTAVSGTGVVTNIGVSGMNVTAYKGLVVTNVTTSGSGVVTNITGPTNGVITASLGSVSTAALPSIPFSKLPTLYWANLTVSSASSTTTTPVVSTITVQVDSSNKCKMSYDSTEECMKFTFN